MRQVSVSKPRAQLLKDLFVRNLGVLCGNAHPAVGVPSADVLLLTKIPVSAAYEQPGLVLRCRREGAGEEQPRTPDEALLRSSRAGVGSAVAETAAPGGRRRASSKRRDALSSQTRVLVLNFPQW